MKSWIKDRIARIRLFGRRIQAAALRTALWLVYFVGIGATRAWVVLFHPRLLSGPRRDAPSLWLGSRGYSILLSERGRQS
jgi:hypothetical protein